MDNIDQILFKILGKNKEQQNQFYLQKLRHHWPEIIGSVNARHGEVFKIDRRVLYIKTDSSDWSSQFLMLKQVILRKVNSFLQTETLKDIRLINSSLLKRIRPVKEKPDLKRQELVLPELDSSEKQAALASLPHFTDKNLADRAAAAQLKRVQLQKFYRQQGQKTCSGCGAYLTGAEELCPVCARKQLEAQKAFLAKEIKSRPWLKYRDLSNSGKCDKILFSWVKDSLKAFYFEKVRQNSASLEEEQLAVLLQCGKRPEQLKKQEYENIVSFLRGKKNVRTSGKQLHYQKR